MKWIAAIIMLLSANCFGQSASIKLGAYYFDGWTGLDSVHITKRLKKAEFADREPKWGWITSSQKIVDQQILTASGAGISFFAFCSYYSNTNNIKANALNNALGFYRKSKYHSKIDYCLTIINHDGFTINKANWVMLMPEWIKMFKSDQYVTVDGNPLIIFYSLASLIKEFGGRDSVRVAFDQLRLLALLNGLKGVTISVCVKPIESHIQDAEKCGVDLLTGYNYHEYGYGGAKQKISIEKLQQFEVKVWNKISSLSYIKYMPAITLNWDPRPWANKSNDYDTQHFYYGFSAESVKSSINGGKRWIFNNKSVTTHEKLIVVYAWNENGEGSWLTPGKYGFKPLRGVKSVLAEN